MTYNDSFSRKLFMVTNYCILILVCILCILPFINLFSISLSGSSAVTAGYVKFWPVEFNLKSYEHVLNSDAFLKSVLVSMKRAVLGVSVNMILTVFAAYPLSKEKKAFKNRGKYAWFFILTLLFNYGLIPWYMIVKFTGLMDSIWALVLPGGLPVFNMIVLMNFFRTLPKELEEAAFIDGAGHLRTLFEIFIPISKPALATVTLFCIVYHWNAWFDGLILMNTSEHYPLQSYLQTIIVDPASIMNKSKDYKMLMQFINARTSKAAQLFIAIIPVVVVYPFLQKYFTAGLVMGSVKG